MKDEVNLGGSMTPSRQANLSLGLTALLAFVFWRAEVEWRGWDGLTWIRYFHVAVPAAIAVFLVWIWVWLDAPSGRKKARVIFVLTLCALIATPLTEGCLKAAFSRFRFFVVGPFWPLLFWWLLSPTIVVGILRAFRISIGWRRWALGQILFVLAWPLATVLIQVFPQHGHMDATHAFKSGLVVPFFLVALGMTIPTRK
jgi:hypothetical protein